MSAEAKARYLGEVARGVTPTHAHLRSRILFRVVVTVVLDVVASVFVYLFERHAAGTEITTVGDSLFWTRATGCASIEPWQGACEETLPIAEQGEAMKQTHVAGGPPGVAQIDRPHSARAGHTGPRLGRSSRR